MLENRKEIFMKKKCIGNYEGYDLFLTISRYNNNNRLYVGLDTYDGMYDDLTVNLSDLYLPSNDYIFLNGDIDNKFKEFLKEKNIIGDTIETYKYNMGHYDMVMINHELLKQYSPDEYKEYENYKLENCKENDDLVTYK